MAKKRQKLGDRLRVIVKKVDQELEDREWDRIEQRVRKYVREIKAKLTRQAYKSARDKQFAGFCTDTKVRFDTNLEPRDIRDIITRIENWAKDEGLKFISTQDERSGEHCFEISWAD